ncbi:MAG TPA: ChbG/HpnK family deacetylase [Bryobacteraceae bacterium]|nr:ChbG/HpnK family deacetylase [Bryobacteraceae bacterium]
MSSPVRNAPRLLVVNADDFGFTPDVNEGIVEAHREGILTATTLMANGDAFEDAVDRARPVPTLDIGCHLVLVGGASLLTGRPLPATIPQLLGALARRQIRVYDELRLQILRILEAGIQPTHLDTHKHTHLAPPVLEAVARLAEEFGIGWVRRPFDFPLRARRAAAPFARQWTSRTAGLLRPRFHRVLEAHHCRTTDHFAGFQITGRFRTRELVELLLALPEGSTELMCHPGRCGEALRRAPTRLKESREAELEALLAAESREAIGRAGIRLVSYRQLS